ncbi:MAG: hypothetical protein H6573_03575 [Lewinellaceae bacterium]|nr:hypothetical protein [Phaeodactylibacter sp.]MCB0614316.1 hypothetical protein [Phaeodactylibacter sp.]MCB9346576.1 hypothetical protein [Lewinellaceae bacterium]
MTTITHWINTELAEALGRALLHSLWQGAAIALLLAASLILARGLSSTLRYGMALSPTVGLLLARNRLNPNGQKNSKPVCR